MTRFAPAVAAALVAAGAAFVVGLLWGTFAAGGSDSSCYLNQARLFASGTTRIEQPLVLSAPWPRAEFTFTPAGHVPSRAARDAIVPMCPPGLPLLMAAARIVRLGEFIVVPLLGALAVWLTFVLGRRFESPAAGATSAVLFACSPIFLYQVVQPMTDVPAAACWLLAIVLAIPDEGTQRSQRAGSASSAWNGVPRALAAGLATGIAILTRPNLLPLASLIAIYLARLKPSPYIRPSTDCRSAKALAERSARLKGSPYNSAAKRLAWYIAGIAPGVIVLAILQWRMYGSPLATGYGAPGDLFRATNVVPNLARYPRWLLETHTPVLALALAAPFVLRRRADAWLCLTVAIATIAAYLPYQVFNDWWYIRFLLPAVPLLIVLTVAIVHRALNRGDRREFTGVTASSTSAAPGTSPMPRTSTIAGISAASAVSAVFVFTLGGWWIHVARERRAFQLRDLERPYVDAGMFVAERLTANTAFLTVKDSGAVQYYAQRPTVLWDMLPSHSLDRALDFLRAQGLRPLLLVDTTEEPEFRARFSAASAIGALDWPPIARVGRTVRVYDPADRARYLAGATIQTIDVWPVHPRR